MTEKTLLEKRNRMKKKKPVFVRREAQHQVRIKPRWRKPRGKHSPVRRKKKGKQRMVTTGHGSPKAVHGLHSSGLQKVVVATVGELKALSEKQGAIISSNVGDRKRIILLQAAIDNKVILLNVRDAQKTIDDIQKAFEERKSKRASQIGKKVKKSEEKKKEEKTDKKVVDEKEKERKEAEKTIIKKQ